MLEQIRRNQATSDCVTYDEEVSTCMPCTCQAILSAIPSCGHCECRIDASKIQQGHAYTMSDIGHSHVFPTVQAQPAVTALVSMLSEHHHD